MESGSADWDVRVGRVAAECSHLTVEGTGRMGSAQSRAVAICYMRWKMLSIYMPVQLLIGQLARPSSCHLTSPDLPSELT